MNYDGTVAVGAAGRKKALLFLQKKKQKNSYLPRVWQLRGQGPQAQKFFGYFFSKK